MYDVDLGIMFACVGVRCFGVICRCEFIAVKKYVCECFAGMKKFSYLCSVFGDFPQCRKTRKENRGCCIQNVGGLLLQAKPS